MPPKIKTKSTPSIPSTRTQSTRLFASSSNVADDHGLSSPETDKFLKYILLKIDDKFAEFKAEIAAIVGAKDERIGQLEEEVTALKEKVHSLEDRVVEAECKDRQSDIIFSGSVVSSSVPEGVSIGSAVRSLLQNKVNYVLSAEKMISVSRIGQKPINQGPDKRRIIIRLGDRSTKNDIIHAVRIVKPTDLYANDNLTTERSRILFALRHAKRRYPQHLSGCGSHDGRVFAWMKPPNSTGRNHKVIINSWSKLESVCVEFLSIRAEELLDASPQQ